MIVFFLALIMPLGLTQAASSTCPPPGPDPKCDEETEMMCPGVTFEAGQCPQPAFCQPLFDEWFNGTDGKPCPMSCPVQCDWDAKETVCPGPTINGCYVAAADICVPFSGRDDCDNSCTPTCDEEAGQILCPGGKNPRDGCPISDYCVKPHGDCPAVCNPQPCNRDAGERVCYNERDENGCYTGGYCAITCHN